MKPELAHSQKCLDNFIKGVEELYGLKHASYCVHLLAHLPTSVKNWGPLWTHSAFIYEDYNQTLKSYVHSPKGLGVQICDSYRMKFAIDKLDELHKSELSVREKKYIDKKLSI